MRTTSLLALAVLLAVPGRAPAATLRVPSDHATIQAAVDAAASGDTVLVAPGTYTDVTLRFVGGSLRHACLFLKTGVAVVSEGGPSVTRIDMQYRSELEFPHVVYGNALGPVGATVWGFTLVGSPQPYEIARVVSGGVIGGRVEFRDCWFPDGDGATSGGVVVSETHLVLTDCRFERCRASGSSAVWVSQASFEIRGCTFQDGEGTGVQGFGEYPNGHSALIEDSVFLRNRDPAGNGGGLAVSQYGGGCMVRRCVFIENEAQSSGGGAQLGNSTNVVEDCVFLRNRSWTSVMAAVGIGSGAVRRCTFHGNTAAPYSWASVVNLGGSPAEFSGNVLSGSTGGAALGVNPGVIATGGCNVFWNNAGGHAENYTLAVTDRIVDPRLCDPPADDIRLMPDSPCLPANSGGCGLVGAEDEACGTVSLEPKSWGTTKSWYRNEEEGS